MTKEAARRIMQTLHKHGRVASDGSLVLDPNAIFDELMATEPPTTARGDEDQDEHDGDGCEEDGAYDPVAEGKRRAKQQMNQRERSKDALR
jgi:hypothetical protein